MLLTDIGKLTPTVTASIVLRQVLEKLPNPAKDGLNKLNNKLIKAGYSTQLYKDELPEKVKARLRLSSLYACPFVCFDESVDIREKEKVPQGKNSIYTIQRELVFLTSGQYKEIDDPKREIEIPQGHTNVEVLSHLTAAYLKAHGYNITYGAPS